MWSIIILIYLVIFELYFYNLYCKLESEKIRRVFYAVSTVETFEFVNSVQTVDTAFSLGSPI